jgi:hypothetical protein
MREYRRAILASDNELNVQIQRLAFGVRISINDPNLKREQRIGNGAHFIIVYHLTVEFGAEMCTRYLWYRYGARVTRSGNEIYIASSLYRSTLFFVCPTTYVSLELCILSR